LQGGHVTFKLRFRGALVLLLEFTRLESDGAAISIRHDRQRMSIVNGCYDTRFATFL